MIIVLPPDVWIYNKFFTENVILQNSQNDEKQTLICLLGGYDAAGKLRRR